MTVATPPTTRFDPVKWARTNLFSTWRSSLATLVLGPLLAVAAFRLVRFLTVSARWEIVEQNLALYLVGPFPREQLWRLWLALAILALASGIGGGALTASARESAIAAGKVVATPISERIRRLGPPAVLLFSLLVFARGLAPFLLTATVVGTGVCATIVGRRMGPVPRRYAPAAVLVGVVGALVVVTAFGGVPASRWGGLLITVFYTIAALLLAFPIGILFALGRRSTLPMVRWICTAYVEFFRGSPLITLLFVGWLILPFFLPPDFPTPGLVTRALIVFVLFTSAYVAEIVRGGLQAVGQGQVEAAQALGLTPWRQTGLVVLPQALKAVIPGLVGQAISLFKDTTLVLIIGQSDLLSVARAVTKQDEFLGKGYIVESLAFVAIIYWVASYWMSRESQRLEARLGVGRH